MRRDPDQIRFVPVEPQHYPLLRTWLGAPHVREWWGDPDEELGFIRDVVEGRDSTRPFLIAVDGDPVGYIQCWFVGHHQNAQWAADHPWLLDLPAETVGVDLSIGRPDKAVTGHRLDSTRGLCLQTAGRGPLRDHYRSRSQQRSRCACLYQGRLSARPHLQGRTGDVLIMHHVLNIHETV